MYELKIEDNGSVKVTHDLNSHQPVLWLVISLPKAIESISPGRRTDVYVHLTFDPLTRDMMSEEAAGAGFCSEYELLVWVPASYRRF